MLTFNANCLITQRKALLQFCGHGVLGFPSGVDFG